MAQVMLSFDTEDFMFPRSSYAAARIANTLAGEGVRGAFNVVGEVARAMRALEPFVIDSLRAHEINYHSLRHTWHPTIPELCDAPSWYEGYGRFIAQEAQGIRLVKQAFGVEQLYAAVPPGNSISAQAAYGYGQLGIPVYNGSLFHQTQGLGIWYAGTLSLENNFYMEDLVFGRGMDGFLDRLDELAQWDRLIICDHPNMVPYQQFWDAVNLQGENRVSWGQWVEPQRRAPEEEERFYRELRRMIRALKAHGGFEFVDNAQVYARLACGRRPALERAWLPELRAQLAERFFFVRHAGACYSLAELFFACAHFLAGRTGACAAENALGPVDRPYAAPQRLHLERAALAEAAGRLDRALPVPAQLEVGGQLIGPADFLRAALALLAEGGDSVEVEPGAPLPDTSAFYRMDDFRLAGTWMHSERFSFEGVIDRLRWQAWSIHPER